MRRTEDVHFGTVGAEGFVRKFLGQAADDVPVFIVAGKKSYSLSGAADFFSPLLAGKKPVHFSGFSPNPDIGELRTALVLYKESMSRLIVSVGGGTAIDIGKLVNYFAATGGDPAAYPGAAGSQDASFAPLLAVPTTAGSGSEATHFAVLYDGAQKLSVAHEELVPSHAWLNEEFTASMSTYQAAVSAFDAFAQAVESYWAVGSTSESRQDSAEAVRLCLRHMEGAVGTAAVGHRGGMLKAAHLAGRAINVAKTTAAHAMSYALTAHYGLAHGHAVAMTLPALFEANAEVSDFDVNDRRGAAHVRGVIEELCALLGAVSAEGAAFKIRELTARIGLGGEWFSTRGIDPSHPRALVLKEINAERLANNPRRLDAKELAWIVSHIR